jgi:hypothetical protein
VWLVVVFYAICDLNFFIWNASLILIAVCFVALGYQSELVANFLIILLAYMLFNDGQGKSQKNTSYAQLNYI